MDNVLEAVYQGSISLILRARNWIFNAFERPSMIEISFSMKSPEQTIWLILNVWPFSMHNVLFGRFNSFRQTILSNDIGPYANTVSVN